MNTRTILLQLKGAGEARIEVKRRVGDFLPERVKEGGETHHLTIGCEGGYFCPECPTAVLNSQTFEEIISQNVQSRTLEYAHTWHDRY